MAKFIKGDKRGNSPDFMFVCPGCGYLHGVWTTRSPEETHPVWKFNGDIDNPTVSPSLLVRGQYLCHSFIKDGKIQFLKDCDHSLAGKTVELYNV